MLGGYWASWYIYSICSLSIYSLSVLSWPNVTHHFIKTSARDAIVTPTRQGGRRRTGCKSDFRFTEQNSISLGRASFLILLLCVEPIEYKIQLLSPFTLPNHDREPRPAWLRTTVPWAALCPARRPLYSRIPPAHRRSSLIYALYIIIITTLI